MLFSMSSQYCEREHMLIAELCSFVRIVLYFRLVVPFFDV